MSGLNGRAGCFTRMHRLRKTVGLRRAAMLWLFSAPASPVLFGARMAPGGAYGDACGASLCGGGVLSLLSPFDVVHMDDGWLAAV